MIKELGFDLNFIWFEFDRSIVVLQFVHRVNSYSAVSLWPIRYTTVSIVIRTNIILFYTAKIYMYAAKYALDIGKNNINLLSFTQLCHER